MNIITPLILIIISIGAFFAYIDPNYRGTNLDGDKKSVQALQAEHAEYQQALSNTETIRAQREILQGKKSSFRTEDLTRLSKLLPDNVDNIQLVIDMNNIARNHNLVLKGIKLDTDVKAEGDRLGADNNLYGTVGLSFSVLASYNDFQNFLSDLEKSLRLVDITSLAVIGSETGVYDFSVSLKTYWLK